MTPSALREVAAMPVAWAASLPLPPSVWTTAPDGSLRAVWTLSRAVHTSALAERTPAFVGGDLKTSAAGAALGRARPSDYAAWVERKTASPRWKIPASVAQTRRGQPPELNGITVGEWAAELGIVIVDVAPVGGAA